MFGMYYHLMALYQVCSNYDPRAENGPIPVLKSFLAHLAHSANVSFWDCAVSVVRRRASSVFSYKYSYIGNFEQCLPGERFDAILASCLL